MIFITLGLYAINQSYKTNISHEYLRWFMCCYFNDVIGGITFIAYTNAILHFSCHSIKKLAYIELLLFGCGLFWELITPLFRKNTVADPWDIIAYMVGGVIYWIITKIYTKYLV